jgi:very-short-patch-repair endonuclease
MSELEKKFIWYWVHVIKGTGDLTLEHKFHPSRKWRFDFAHIPTKVAVEIEGGIGLRKAKSGKLFTGRHAQSAGFNSDCEKYNEAALMGWTVFRLTSKMVTSTDLEKIASFIKQRPILN